MILLALVFIGYVFHRCFKSSQQTISHFGRDALWSMGRIKIKSDMVYCSRF